MKSLSLLLLTGTLLIAAASPAKASERFLKASVTGTVETEIQLNPSGSRTHIAILDDKRIFQEFQVSKTDYQLVADVSGNSSLVLIPKHALGILQRITIIQGMVFAPVTHSKAHISNFICDYNGGSTTNLFQGFDGKAFGTFTFSDAAHSFAITKFNFSIIGLGSDQGLSGIGTALVKFKVTTTGVFTQAP